MPSYFKKIAKCNEVKFEFKITKLTFIIFSNTERRKAVDICIVQTTSLFIPIVH